MFEFNPSEWAFSGLVKGGLLNLSHISCNDETWHCYTLHKKIKKICETRDPPLEFH